MRQVHDEAPSFLQEVLCVMAAQADGDARVEHVKKSLPEDCTLLAVFRTIDRNRFGFITDTALWQFMRDTGNEMSLVDVSCLVHELQLRQPLGTVSFPGRLSIKEFATIIFPLGSSQLDLVRRASSDDIGQLLMCPDVEVRPLASFASHYFIVKLIDAATQVAVAQGSDRKNLCLHSGFNVSALRAAYDQIAGRLGLSLADIARAFHDHLGSQPISNEVLNLLQFRYASDDGISLGSFSEFSRQLKPLSY